MIQILEMEQIIQRKNFSEIIAFEFVVVNSEDYEDNTCHGYWKMHLRPLPPRHDLIISPPIYLSKIVCPLIGHEKFF